MLKTTQEFNFWRYAASGWKEDQGAVIVETPVSLTVNGEIWLSFMCTPIHLDAMAVGFLFNEGLIDHRDEIVSARVCENGENVDIWLDHKLEKPERWWRTSGCTGGVTSIGDEANIETSSGKDKLEQDMEEEPRFEKQVQNHIKLAPRQVTDLVDKILAAQSLYQLSGGVHSSALSDGQDLLVVAEDIGRHNTLDKIAGRCLLEQISPEQRILVTTGRISSEMLQKAIRINAEVVISRTAPSERAIKMADQTGITLIGYARRDQFIVYTQPQRIR